MRVSINTIRLLNEQYHTAGEPAPDGVEALAAKIGAQLGAIEEITDIGARYNNILIVRIVSCEQHPNADRLHVCMVDDGGKAESVARDEQGHVQVVCGAPNVRAGMLAVWLPPGATVPSTYGKEPFVLETRELRGVMSNGMMASPKELSLGDNHDGILEVDEDVAPGTLFVDAYGMRDDYVLDIENKMFTHRPDCFGMIGVAREIAGIQGQPFKSPDWYRADPPLPAAEAPALPLEVNNELPALVPRFTAVVMSNISVHASPVWLQVALSKLGLRPINNVVDLTNYYMVLTGQPLHAYDYDKVTALAARSGQPDGAARITVRYPHPGEKIRLLNGKEIAPRAEAIMIAAGDQLIGVGGVMGGADSEVDEHTANIILECATFDMYSIRRTSMTHGLFTDAVTRFNKGQSPLQNLAVLLKTVGDIRRIAGGRIAGEVVDAKNDKYPVRSPFASDFRERSMFEWQHVAAPVTLDRQFINARLGTDLATEQIKTLLQNVEFEVLAGETGASDSLKVIAPFWRTDIELPEDVVEEVGRLYGFDKLPRELPLRDLTPAPRDPLLQLKARIRAVLRRSGANEVLTYSFVHGNLLEKAGQDRAQAFRLANALSPDLQYYRLSLTPSLLERVHPNIKAGYDRFALFEIGKSHSKSAVDADGLPQELETVALVYATKRTDAKGAAYYEAQRFLTELARMNGLELDIVPMTAHVSLYDMPFEVKRSAVIRVRGSDDAIGVVGEYTSDVIRALKLPAKTAGFELGVAPFVKATPGLRYEALPRFPKLSQDICLSVPADMPYATVAAVLERAMDAHKPDATHVTLEPVDIYKAEAAADHKNMTFRITAASYERTLTDGVAGELLDQLATVAVSELHAARV